MQRIKSWVIWFDHTLSGQPVTQVGYVLLETPPGVVPTAQFATENGLNLEDFNLEFYGPGHLVVPEGETVLVVSCPDPRGGKPYLQGVLVAKALLLASAPRGVL